MQLIKYGDKYPYIAQSSFIASGALIIGDVNVQADSSIWFGAIIRGDVAPVVIGRATNIQDGVIIHTSRHNGPTIVGNEVTIGHRALLHACLIKDQAFIGMAATVMDNAVVEQHAFVAAGALVGPGKIVKTSELWAGVPARFVRYLTDIEIDDIIISSKNYVQLAREYNK